MEEEERVISLKGIIIGSLVDVIGSLVVGMVIGAIWSANYVSSSGAHPTSAELQQYLMNSPYFILTSLLTGLALTAIGGYVAAVIARASELFNAGAVGALGLIFVAISELISRATAPSPNWYLAAALVLTLPAALLGGFLRGKTVPELFE